MRKKAFLIVCLLILQLVFMAGCDNSVTNQGNEDKFIVFISDELGTVEKIKTNGNEIITLPKTPKRTGFHFNGWFWDNETFLLEFTGISLLNYVLVEDLEIYAKWMTENEFKLIGLYEQKLEIEELLDTAASDCHYDLRTKNYAYEDYLSKMNMYDNIYVKKILTYRTGRGMVEIDDPDDIQKKHTARIAMNNAKEYYDVCVALYESAKELFDTYTNNYEVLLSEIVLLGGTL